MCSILDVYDLWGCSFLRIIKMHNAVKSNVVYKLFCVMQLDNLILHFQICVWVRLTNFFFQLLKKPAVLIEWSISFGITILNYNNSLLYIYSGSFATYYGISRPKLEA